MRLEEMILVMKSKKGEHTNCLSTFNDYLKDIIEANGDNPEDLTLIITELFDTKEDPARWSAQRIAANTTIHARFCHDEQQLRGFLLGYFNDRSNSERVSAFDAGSCPEECLAVLEAYNMKTDGHSGKASFKYVKLEHSFQIGEIVRNLNGSDYRVLDALTEDNILFLCVSSGEINIGVDTKYYARMPRSGDVPEDSIIYGMSWDHGIYLGNSISRIDFEEVRKEYGRPERIETLEDYRSSIKKTFLLYKRLMDNEQVSDAVRSAATISIYDEFRTAKSDYFLEHLDDGEYDGGFQKQKVRSGPRRTEKTR